MIWEDQRASWKQSGAHPLHHEGPSQQHAATQATRRREGSGLAVLGLRWGLGGLLPVFLETFLTCFLT